MRPQRGGGSLRAPAAGPGRSRGTPPRAQGQPAPAALGTRPCRGAAVVEKAQRGHRGARPVPSAAAPARTAGAGREPRETGDGPAGLGHPRQRDAPEKYPQTGRAAAGWRSVVCASVRPLRPDFFGDIISCSECKPYFRLNVPGRAARGERHWHPHGTHLICAPSGAARRNTRERLAGAAPC